MPISATGRSNDRASAGFSLIEIMIVTAIIGVVSISAILSLRIAPGQSPSAEVGALARAVRFLQDEALMTRRSLALSFAGSEWQVLSYDPAARAWSARATSLPHASGGWNEDFSAALTIEGRRATPREAFAAEPDVLLLSSGETTPFSLTLSADGGARAGCTLGAYGELSCAHGE